MKRAHATFASLAVVAVVACGSRPAPTPAPPTPLPVPVGSAKPAPTVAAKPTTPSSPCRPLAPGEISEEDTPSIAGVSKKVNAGTWLGARGVTKAAFRTWVRSREPRFLEDFDADSLYDNDDSCETLTVGDKAEDALVCTLSVRTSIMRFSASAFVVRNKRIVSVLEVGYALPAMDWPDARWLDLQLVFEPGGLEADLHDRAPAGTVLVPPPRYCKDHYARYLACEEAHRNGAPLQDVCPMVMENGKTFHGHHTPTPGESPMGGDRVDLQGCAQALPKLEELIKQTSPKDMFAAEFRADRAFAVKACNARGHYVWTDGRFVRASTRPATSAP